MRVNRNNNAWSARELYTLERLINKFMLEDGAVDMDYVSRQIGRTPEGCKKMANKRGIRYRLKDKHPGYAYEKPIQTDMNSLFHRTGKVVNYAH